MCKQGGGGGNTSSKAEGTYFSGAVNTRLWHVALLKMCIWKRKRKKILATSSWKGICGIYLTS